MQPRRRPATWRKRRRASSPRRKKESMWSQRKIRDPLSLELLMDCINYNKRLDLYSAMMIGFVVREGDGGGEV